MGDPFVWHLNTQPNGLVVWTPGKGEKMGERDIFSHECIHPSCEINLLNDDEPWCHLHSPNTGPSLRGYSARKAAEQFEEMSKKANVEHRNIFEGKDDG